MGFVAKLSMFRRESLRHGHLGESKSGLLTRTKLSGKLCSASCALSASPWFTNRVSSSAGPIYIPFQVSAVEIVASVAMACANRRGIA